MILWLIWPSKATETGIIEKNSPPTTYEDDRCKNEQITWLQPEEIPETFGFTNDEETAPAEKEETRAVIVAGASMKDIVKEIEKYPWDAAIALKIAKCESNFNPYAINYADAEITGYPSMGIFQLNRPYDVKYFDYQVNIRIAYEEFYLKRFWRPWSCAYILGIL